MAYLNNVSCATRAWTYRSEEALQKLMVVNQAMHRRLLPRRRRRQCVDTKYLQAGGAQVARQQRVFLRAVLDEILDEVLRQAAEVLESCLSPESVV